MAKLSDLGHFARNVCMRYTWLIEFGHAYKVSKECDVLVKKLTFHVESFESYESSYGGRCLEAH